VRSERAEGVTLLVYLFNPSASKGILAVEPLTTIVKKLALLSFLSWNRIE
jgi:hypothetical protein